METDNPVIRLCVQGVEAEEEARFDEARSLFEHAWRASRDDAEACLAAHYIARRQPTPEQALWWNQIALARADSVRDGRMRTFYSSLHLNLGMSHESLGQVAVARHHYQRAAETLGDIHDEAHRTEVEQGIHRGLQRTRTQA